MSVTTWGLWILAGVYVIIPIVLWYLSPRRLTQDDLNRRKRAIVLVLGDLGRSPRMNYHALSIANCGYDVDLCGYTESPLIKEVEQHERISVHSIASITNSRNWPFVVFAVYKVLQQHLQLFKLLKSLKDAEYLLVQNPPSIPVLGVSRWYCLVTSPRTKLIIDWHNLGYSILALKLGYTHPYVRLYKWYESWFGFRAFVHLTVTVSLGAELRDDFKMKGRRIIPLYDRPASQFMPLSDSAKHAIVKKYPDVFDGYNPKTDKLVITATSYTPDENLYTLLKALETYAGSSKTLPRLRVVITGKGPMLEEMKDEIAKLAPSIKDKVQIRTVWLPYEDYPRIVGAADLGVSLHESSSGFDLPMKVLDMFGCGVPAVSVNFPAIPELVKDGDNGLIVDSADEMAEAFERVFTDDKLLAKLTAGAAREARVKWDTNWTTKLGPLFGVGAYRRLAPDELDESSSSDDE